VRASADPLAPAPSVARCPVLPALPAGVPPHATTQQDKDTRAALAAPPYASPRWRTWNTSLTLRPGWPPGLQETRREGHAACAWLKPGSKEP